ncbi:PKD domain-containing protein [Thalassotalea hakodatensis]|uniref:PKD domain-containing protein n=1 Tax=Thalassotalea hakodatensis TaxID=3030492 RepID=UPI002572EFA5|nr:PKD domain-containing protein [Thalassotalea hakodatensis]
MNLNKIILLVLYFSSLHTLAATIETNNKLTNKVKEKPLTVKEVSLSKQLSSKKHKKRSASTNKENLTSHQVCAIDDNGQDWNKLQTLLSKELKKESLSRKLKSKKLRSLANVSYDDNGVNGRYYIPVVFHIYGEEFNCSDESQACLTDEKIQDALRRTNEDFLGTNTQDGPIDPLFMAIRGYPNIEFVLAKKDPSGQVSNGIVRHSRNQKGYGNGSGFDAEIASDAWDNYKYMNVYIMKDLYDDGSTSNSGVAWYPESSMSDKNLSRVVYNGLYVGDNTDENFRSVLTHEFGHWLNLPHTFAGDTCSLENETFCSLTGDRSCDTPQMSLSSDMYDNSLNCLGKKTNTENFMHYTSNYAMFTQDQVKRITAALHSPMRNTLWSNSNLVATGLEQFTSNSERYWDGVSGIDTAPSGDVIASQHNLSGIKGDVDNYQINIPTGTEAVGFYLSGYKEDPDMYASLGKVSAKDSDGNWDADYISFEAAGTPEFIGVLSPSTTKPYYITIDAFSDYNNANLDAIGVDDPLLAEGSKRHHVFIQPDIWSPKGKAPKQFSFQIPQNVEKTVIVLAGKYGGDPDMYVSVDKPVVINQELDDCVPFSAAKLAEYCEFDRGGKMNVLIDPFAEYWESTLHVYYETKDQSNQPPIAITPPNYRAVVEHEVHFKGNSSIDVDGSIESYLWDFGDGQTSTEINPIHNYANIGDYSVSLTITDNEGISASTTSIASITLLNPDDETLCENCNRVYLAEEIGLSAEAGDAPRHYQFLIPDAASLVAIEIVGGSSGDPDLHVSRNQEVSLTNYDCRPWEGPGAAEVCHFREGGVYNVMIDPAGTYSDVTFKAYYDIRNDADNSLPNQLPIAKIESIGDAYAGGLTSLIGDSSSDPDGNIVSYLWDFGDGNTSTDANPQHTYQVFGKYQPMLTVKDNNGAEASTSIDINILVAGDMDADGDVDKVDLQNFILALRRGENLDRAFDLNKDGRVNNRDVRYFKAICSYANCSNIAPQSQEPLVNITLPDSVVVNQHASFNSEQSIADPSDRYSYIDSYQWSFGDGATSSDKNPIHIFSSVGSYDVSLTLVNNNGLTSTHIETIHVAYPPLEDSCNDQVPAEGNTLENGEISCVTGDKTRFDFTIPENDRHQSLALTIGFAEGDFKVYYKNGGWPSIGSEIYDSMLEANKNGCLFIDLQAGMNYWSYIQITGDVSGATIVADFDTQGCRSLVE